MHNHLKCYGIIPSRFESTRFPGKPLAKILGKPMFWHVYERARKCGKLLKVVLATDDTRIFKAAKDLNVPVLMTRADHPSGTDRVMEAADILKIPDDAIVINIQGDEPALDPELLSELINPFSDPDVKVTTPVKKIGYSEAINPDRVKVVFSKNKRALYFSRSVIPYPGADQKNLSLYCHIGLYAFRMKVLKQFVDLSPTILETTEKLEQLRLLENSIPINVVVTEYRNIGVDRPEDIKHVTDVLRTAIP